VTHPDLRRHDSLHRHQQQAVWRQQQAKLHANEKHDAEPDEVDAQLLHDGHEDRQRNQHHAHLIDENAKKDQDQHHSTDDRVLRQTMSGDQRHYAVACS
jgi:hypothetical protein